MRSLKRLTVTAVVAITTLLGSAYAETPSQAKARVLQETQLIWVDPSSLSGPLAQYQDDGDPMTLEFVVFSSETDRPSRISDNGEVIFLYAKESERVRQQLIQKAFEIRISRAAGGT